MKALETLAIYLTPFLVLGVTAKLWLKRRAVDLTEVRLQAGPNRRLKSRGTSWHFSEMTTAAGDVRCWMVVSTGRRNTLS